jgi:ATP-dependent Lon protease
MKNIINKKYSKSAFNNNNTNSLQSIIEKKIIFFKDIIQKTLLHINKNKILNILGISDVNICTEKLNELNNIIITANNSVLNKSEDTELLINDLQKINNEISSVFKSYGSLELNDLLLICFGNNNIANKCDNTDDKLKFELLQKYFHPISYKIINKLEDKNNLDCFDINNSYKQFYVKVHGVKIYIYNSSSKKGLLIYGLIDDIILDFIDNKFVKNKLQEIKNNIPNDNDFKSESFDKYLNSLVLKDILINKNISDFYEKYVGYINKINVFKQKPILQNIKDFIAEDLFSKRTILIYLLIKSDNYENQYLAYLLYDLLSNDINGSIDTEEQTMLFDSFPWNIRQIFKKAMKNTITYTNELSNFDMNKISLEQQICLLKSDDSVKEKAMVKLKEIKAKSEDTGSKARQYLDGLLKIPFSIYKKEPILYLMDTIRSKFKDLYKKYNVQQNYPQIVSKDKYTNLEILKYIKIIKNSFGNNFNSNELKQKIINGNKEKIIKNIINVNNILVNFNLDYLQINYKTKKKSELISNIDIFINQCINDVDKKFLLDELNVLFLKHNNTSNLLIELSIIEENINKITEYMKNVKIILDKTVHGHENAKKQIERIISQWINGEQKGNCLGFEGSPGVGKTTFARGLSECLKDENNVSRPFSLIMMGGDANGSHLVGHSYTYVGSTWGQIVQIIIDKKCMNPIILIDEVDKISRTEHGKEITGILTHLLDPTQNDSFQDKYFSGIDLDLSKVLFILSYNDVDVIDKVLLDRIHRIKFDSLSIEDKLEICNKHLLPEIYKTVGLEDMIEFSNETIKFIIEEYTLEPGVRKLKEKLYDIISEINLDILKKNDLNGEIEIPIVVTIEEIKKKYFKDEREIRKQKIHGENTVGQVNCLWANVYNVGGILGATAKFYPSNNYLAFKPTGLLDKMMEESFQISLTIAFNLTDTERKSTLNNQYNGEQKYGIHLHMGDGSIEKSGTSAGIAVTILLYSLLNNKKIKNDFAVTGEAVDLHGKVGEIGALKTKIIYGIKAGVKNFIYPAENKKDFSDFMEKYENTDLVKDINFYPVNTIEEALELIIES